MIELKRNANIQRRHRQLNEQTKNIITRETVKKELLFVNGADIRTAIIGGVILSPLCIPLAVGSISEIIKEFNNVIIEIVVCFLLGVILILPVAAIVFTIITKLLNRRSIDKGEFEITARELLYKEEKYERRGRHHRTVKVLHFSDFDVVTSGGTVYQLASADDRFYLVHYRGKSSVLLFYPEKMYEYKES